MRELPKGWVSSTLANVSSEISYGFTTKSSPVGSGARLLRITDIQDYSVTWSSLPFCSDQPNGSFLVRNGDIVVARTGATTGKSYLISNVPIPTAFASYLIRIATSPAMVPEYVWKFMQGPDYWGQIQVVSKGTAQPGASAAILGQVQVPIPPALEQKRIVAKLDALSAKSARARTELARIETLVSRYKQAVLSETFRGEKSSSVSLLELSEFITSGSRGWAKYYSNTGPIFIRIGNTVRGRVVLDLGDIQRVTPPAGAEGVRTRVRENDIVVTITADLGRIGLVTRSIGEAYVNQHLALVRLIDDRAAPFIAWYLVSDEGQAQLSKNNRGATRAGLGLDDIRDVMIPYPPIERQQAIVRGVETAFARIDRLAEEAKRALTLVGKLDEAILAKAFRGELVPQDENDEPASVLLKRIRAERAAAPKPKRGRTSRP